MKKNIIVIVIYCILSLQSYAFESNVEISDAEAFALLSIERDFIINKKYPSKLNNKFALDVDKLSRSPQLITLVRTLSSIGLYKKIVDPNILIQQKKEFNAIIQKHNKEFDKWLKTQKEYESFWGTIKGRGIIESVEFVLNTSINIANGVMDVVTLGGANLEKSVYKIGTKLPNIATKMSNSKVKGIVEAAKILTSNETQSLLYVLGLTKNILNENYDKVLQDTGVYVVKLQNDVLIPKEQKTKALYLLGTKILEASGKLLAGAGYAIFDKNSRHKFLEFLGEFQDFIPVYGAFYKQYQDSSKFFDKPTNETIEHAMKLHYLNERHQKEYQEIFEKQNKERLKNILNAIHEKYYPIYFNDVTPNVWFYPAITYLAKAGYLNTANTYFRWNANVSAYEMAVVLIHIFNMQKEFSSYEIYNYGNFPEGEKHVAKTYAYMTKKREILVTGITKDSFNKPLTRNQMSEMIIKFFFKAMGMEPLLQMINNNTIIKKIKIKNFIFNNNRKNVSKLNKWNNYSSALNTMCIANGYGDGSFGGNKYIIRSEAFALIYKTFLLYRSVK